MKKLNNYTIFLSSPSDVKNEKKIAKEVIDELNISFEDISLSLIGFGISTYSSASGHDGQDILNKMIGEDYDIYIGIMWKKFGSKTLREESGTIEEFHKAYKRFKKNPELMRLGFYFNTKNTNLNDINLNEIKKINEFKNEFKNNEYEMIYLEYNNFKEFRRLFQQNISIFINQISKNRIEEFQDNKIEELINIEVIDFYKNALDIENIKFNRVFENDDSNINLILIGKLISCIQKSNVLLKKSLDSFDNIMNKMLSNISKIIIYYNYQKKIKLKQDIFIKFSKEFVKIIEAFKSHINSFEKVYSEFNRIGNSNIMLKTICSDYKRIAKEAIHNFNNYIIVIQTYKNFMDNTLKIESDLNMNKEMR